MEYYQEITLRPGPEIPLNFLWTKVYTQIHLALVAQKDTPEGGSFGVSFPEYTVKEKTVEQIPDAALMPSQPDTKQNASIPKTRQGKGQHGQTLGGKLRIFAPSEEALQKLNVEKALSRLLDYVRLTNIRRTPVKIIKGYATYSREHAAASQQQKARRFARRHNLSLTEALSRFPATNSTPALPYIQMKSLTNQQKFNLFIKKQSAAHPQLHPFSLYGLSLQSTVPEF